MNENKIIFHYPGKLSETLNTGETKRPVKMLHAFQNLGYDVTCITGTRSERRTIFNEIKSSLKTFDFIYSENSNIPLDLCCSSRLPSLHSVDIALFKNAACFNIPTGVFYRDIFWRYSPFKEQIGLLKFYLALPFYIREMRIYDKFASKIFLPSERSKSWLPVKNVNKLAVLPPGEPIHPIKKADNNKEHFLNLLYVGSIRPPKYDLTLLFQNLAILPKESYSLIVNTRKDDWDTYSSFYNTPESFQSYFASGANLKPLYEKADIALCFMVPDEYWKIALPLKLFEAIGYGLPIISYGDSAVSDFVRENDIGWVVNEDDKQNIFEYLINNRNEIAEKRKNVLAIRSEHTWEKRAEKVAKTLMKKKQ
jgi:glycosyltransferase involved in cell wall biosynthesis